LQTVLNGEIGEYDPRDAEQSELLHRMADLLLEDGSRTESLEALEKRLIQGDEDVPLPVHLAVKLARSKAVVRALERPLHVSFVFAVYKEHTRMLRPDQHPHGEDFVVRKVEQLRWLFDDFAPVTWSILIVDDGCPEGSGRLAQRIVDERCPGAPVRVLFLEDAITQGVPITHPMKSAADSQKGGSVVYGMWTAAQELHDRHIVVFTDADLSLHLGQSGLLIDGIVHGGVDAAIGSRREPTSVVVKEGHRNTRGKLFIYLWKGLIRPLHYITDTQCGFKAFSAETVRDVCPDLLEKRFAFDIELLLKTELRHNDAIRRTPVAWVDSEAASTTTGLQPYLPMLQAVVAMYRKYLPSDPEADRLADMIESMTETEWTYLTEHVPAAIADGDPAKFERSRPVAVDELIGAMRP
jgi:hypothetical protein